MTISRLRGLAMYHADSPSLNLDVSPKDLTNLLETIKCLQLLGHNILIYAGEERRQFKVFSKWLRHEIDVQATTSEPSPEEEEKDPGIDYGMLLQYLSGGLTRSKLSPFLGRLSSASGEAKKDIGYEAVKKATELHKKQMVGENEALNVQSVYGSLQRQAGEVFKQITAWQMSGCRIGGGLLLEDEEISTSEARMIHEVGGMLSPNPAGLLIDFLQSSGISEYMSTYVALVPDAQSTRSKRSETLVLLSITDLVKYAYTV